MKAKIILRFLMHAIFPERCPFCGQVMEFGSHCCEECKDRLNFLDPNICPVCHRKECDCVESGLGLGRAVAVFEYDGCYKDAIGRLKFRDGKAYAQHLGYYLAKQVRCQPFVSQLTAVSFVPMTSKKQKRRGYNQAEELAKAVGEELNLPVIDCLEKIHDTEEQHTLSSSERKRNLLGAYKLKENRSVKDACILLIDDVYTTGATLKECGSVLIEAGAGQVHPAAVCRTPRKEIVISSEKREAERLLNEIFCGNMK